MRLCDSIKDIQRQRLGAAVEHNDVILTLGLHTTSRIGHTPISHVSWKIFILNNIF